MHLVKMTFYRLSLHDFVIIRNNLLTYLLIRFNLLIRFYFLDFDIHQFNDKALGLKYIEILLHSLKSKNMKCNKTGYYVSAVTFSE